MNSEKEAYIAFLRGINVGGYHKVPMADLRIALEKLNCENVVTLLNSGNIIFDSRETNVEKLEKSIAKHLDNTFGFPIPTLLRTSKSVYALLNSHPFKDITLTKDVRLYVSFLREDYKTDLTIPWMSSDGAYTILEIHDKMIISVLDISVSKTPKAMEALDKFFGKDITTRNWNTIKRIEKKLDVRP